MSGTKWDAIVIGDGVGALVAAATLATMKARVLWVPHERQTWSFPAGAHRFPVEDGPFVGLAMHSVFPMLADATGIHPNDSSKFKPLSPPLQVLTPAIRMDLPDDADALAAEAQRETGADPKATLAFVKGLDEVQRQTTELLAETARGRAAALNGGGKKSDVLSLAPSALQPAVKAVAGAMSRREPKDLSPGETARVLGAFRGGLYEGPLGPLTLREMLLDRMRMLPVTAMRERRIARVRTSLGRATGVTLDDGSTHDAQVILSSLDAGHAPLLAGGWFGAKAMPPTGVEAVSETFTLHLIVGGDVLPVGLAPRAIVAGQTGDDPILLARHPVNDKGLSRVSITRRLPARAPAEQRQAGLRESLDQIRRYIPFLDDDIRGVFPPIGHSKDLAPEYGGDPWSHVRGPGVFRVPVGTSPFAGPVRGIVRAGADCFPGLGFEGEIAAGAGAARSVSLKLK